MFAGGQGDGAVALDIAMQAVVVDDGGAVDDQIAAVVRTQGEGVAARLLDAQAAAEAVGEQVGPRRADIEVVHLAPGHRRVPVDVAQLRRWIGGFVVFVIQALVGAHQQAVA